jgi:hypothetical protein
MDLTLQDKHTFSALDQAFNTAPTPLPAVVQSQPIVEDDFDQARDTLKRLISKGETALDSMMDVARQSDHPRAFEVTGQLIKTVAETAKDLLALQKTRKEIQGPEEKPQQQIGTQNNIVFAGSTNDLIKALRNRNENIIDAPDQTT